MKSIFFFFFFLLGLFCLVSSLGPKVSPIDLSGEPRYVVTPMGLVWSECLWHMPSGSHIIEKDGVETLIHPNDEKFVIPKCEKPRLRNPATIKKPVDVDSPDSGWQVWATYQNSASFTLFNGYFTVPETPLQWGSADSGILYMFTGLQSDNWVPIANEPPAPPSFDIIQPVLQYGGGSTNGGGMYWGIASWYVTLDNGALYSDLVTVQPGDNIFGGMKMTGSDTWVINSTDVTAGSAPTVQTVTRSRLSSQPWAYLTLETYNIADCTWFPPSGATIEFSRLELEDTNGAVTPSWQVNQNSDHCSAVLTINSPDNAIISF
jgi:hypothetical protein